MPGIFEDTNVALGLPENGAFQAGTSDYDPGTLAEQGIGLPTTAPRASWVYYDCACACYLDSGIVVHQRLPQVNNSPDSLGSCFISDPNIDELAGPGVNLKSLDQFEDVVQRMGHSRYWFRLFGQAMRFGNQIPIPALKSIGKAIAYPHDENPQMAYNKIVGNYSGVQLWYATWSLWYTIAEPPSASVAPVPANLGMHIDDASEPPKQMQAPWSLPDDDAVTFQPVGRLDRGIQ